jgi:capsular exopolysaccharide synthesis family protein
MNLASAIASVGHKTIILDGDLRRPTLHEKFKVNNSGGLSKYLADNTAIKDIIQSTFVNNLDFIPAGPVLPNFSELLETGALDELMQYLDDNYEYIIIDTTPAGIVADAAQLVKYASLTLLVCRDNHTRKEIFSSVLSFFKTNGIDNYEVIYNDREIKESRYGHYQAYYRKATEFKKTRIK